MLQRRNLSNRFESVFLRLLAGEKIDLYEKDLSFMFEIIASNLFAEVPEWNQCILMACLTTKLVVLMLFGFRAWL